MNYSVPEHIHPPDSDERLVACILQGDKQAFGELYDKYAPALLGIITKIAVDKKTSENILQESFLIIWNDLKTHDCSGERLFT